MAYALNQKMSMCSCHQHWDPLTAQEANAFHTDGYLHFLQLLDYNGLDAMDDAPNFVLNPSVCFSESTWRVAFSMHRPFTPPFSLTFFLAMRVLARTTSPLAERMLPPIVIACSQPNLETCHRLQGVFDDVRGCFCCRCESFGSG